MHEEYRKTLTSKVRVELKQL